MIDLLPVTGSGDDLAPAPSLLNFVAAAVSDPNIDVTKLEALLRMQREIVGEDARVQFVQAMSAAQAEIMPVVRKAENTQTRSFYAKLETVDAAIRPIYTKHGFSLCFDEEPSDGPNMMIVCEVSHAAGHSKKYRLNAPPDTLGPKGAPTKTVLHGRGSTVTFLRRYLVCNVFNVVLADMDDDGQRGGMVFITTEQQQQLTILLRETKADLDGFLDFVGAGSIEGIQAKDFGRAMNALAAKKRQMAAKGTAQGEVA